MRSSVAIGLEQWHSKLIHCGVRPETADEWATVFIARVQPECFSYGAREIPRFLGQVLHETQMLERLEEGLNYSALRIRELGMRAPEGSRWRSLVPRAEALAQNPEALANAAYGGRLGNYQNGDGWRYRGSGCMQVTGRTNFELVEKLTGLPVVAYPDLLRQPDTALHGAVLWWEARVKDDAIGSVERMTLAVNGGTEGLDQRRLLTDRAIEAFA